MATKLEEYGLPYDMMQLIQSDPDLMRAFTSFDQNVTPEMPPGALQPDNLIRSLRTPSPAASANPGFNLLANKVNANADALQTRNYTNQIFSPEVLKYLAGTVRTEPYIEEIEEEPVAEVPPQVSQEPNGNAGDGGYGDPPGPLAFEDTPAAAPVVGGYSDDMAQAANLSDDPMDALMDMLSVPDSGGYGEAASGASIGAAPGDGISMGVDGGIGGPGGGADGGGCCFIILEARYGDGTMDNVVRKYRDQMMTDKNRRGYYKLAEVFVPLMRKSAVFKFIVQKTFADPLVSYGKWHFKENKHGWVFAPIKTMWMKVFDVLGGDTEFIRENGQVV